MHLSQKESRYIDIDVLMEHLIEDLSLASIVGRSSAEVATIVERLKEEADRYHAINANRSLEVAEMIVGIGRLRADPRHEALGLMARADALRLLGRNLDAWEAFDGAGMLFLACGDEVGWARTRLGRIGAAHSLGRLNQVLDDCERAREVFTRHGEAVRLVTLDLNLAAVHQLSGRYDAAARLYNQALHSCERLGEQADFYRGPILTNLGLLLTMLGDLRRAIQHQHEALTLFERRGEASDAAVVRLNLADIYLQRGQYRDALLLLYQVRDFYGAAGLPRHAAEAGRSMVEALIQLNRFAEARDAALEALAAFRGFDATYGQAQTLLLLGTAEARLGELDAAKMYLEEAQTNFEALNAPAWAAAAQLGRAEVLLAQNQLDAAEGQATAAQAQLAAAGLEVQAAEAMLLRARALLARDGAAAGRLIRAALAVARRCGIPTLRYSLLVLRGDLLEASGNLHGAIRSYEAAVIAVEQIERHLTITLRPDFLQSRGAGKTRLFSLNLRMGRNEQAWLALERAKAHRLAGYLAGRGAFSWHVEDDRGRKLLDELGELRSEHHRLFRMANGLPAAADTARPAIEAPAARSRLKACEARIRTLSEQLHLLRGRRPLMGRGQLPGLDETISSLPNDTLMVEYGADGERMWAFLIDRAGLRVAPLKLELHELAETIALLYTNLNSALRLGPGRHTRGLGEGARRLLQRLDGMLRSCLPVRWSDYSRIIVVPYGVLHYLPFHLLHDGETYLVARSEVVTLPTAALALRTAPRRHAPLQALVLAHSDNGRLPYTIEEATMVAAQFGGRRLVEDEARRATLAEAGQYDILHLAAHGEHRPDAPEFSYIELADGQLQADDLFQLDLDCGLVTLSACETGRAVVAPGDDLIGLGRSLLYAGAHSLLVSQWRANDQTTVELMRRFYGTIRGGASKAGALRASQCSLLEEDPQAHPAFWGAFQLVGDGGVLSS